MVRREHANDVAGVRQVNQLAFDTPAEANLVDALREQAAPLVSLVADEGDRVVGHIMFSPVTLLSAPDLRIMGLAPLAVVPDRQRHGIGSALVRAGLEECRRLGASAAIVLGHAKFYPRFGFVPASAFGLASEYDVGDEFFMVLELDSIGLSGHAGTIRYHSAFASL